MEQRIPLQIVMYKIWFINIKQEGFMIKGIVFDLDGTIIDSMSVWYKVDRTFLYENGIVDVPSDASEKIRKMTINEAANFFINEFRLDLTPEYIIARIEELVRKEYEENIQLKPHVIELLDLLDKCEIPYCIATATYRGLAEAVLTRCGIIDRFSFIATDAEYPCGKTAPDIFFGCAERLGCSSDEVLVIEDSLHCIKTAAEAGFMTVGIYDEMSAHQRSEIESVADHYIMDLNEIADILYPQLVHDLDRKYV